MGYPSLTLENAYQSRVIQCQPPENHQGGSHLRLNVSLRPFLKNKNNHREIVMSRGNALIHLADTNRPGATVHGPWIIPATGNKD